MATLMPLLEKHLPVVRAALNEDIGAIVHKSSIVIKFLCVNIVLFYLVSFAESIIPYLSVTPGNLIPTSFHIWTLLTYPVLEIHFWNVIIDLTVLMMCARVIEPLWGALEILIYFLVVNTSVAVVAVAVYLLVYGSTGSPDYLFDTHVLGLTGFIAAISVALKQLMPDKMVISVPLVHLRMNHMPTMLCLYSSIKVILGFSDFSAPMMTISGAMFGWLYLRFYQLHNNMRGDLSDSFTFASFFPEIAQPFIAVMANTLYSGLVKAGICKKAVRKYDVGAPSSITISLAGATERVDAERRRQKALKALNERLGKQDDQTAWPSLEDPSQQQSPPTSPNPKTAPDTLAKTSAPFKPSKPVDAARGGKPGPLPGVGSEGVGVSPPSNAAAGTSTVVDIETTLPSTDYPEKT